MGDSFFEKKVCDRCGKKLSSRIESKMNEDVICKECAKEEKKHPRYKVADKIENEELQKGNRNYKGLFAGQKYPFGYDVDTKRGCCSVNGCKMNIPELLLSIDDGKEKIYLCPNDSIGYALGAVTVDNKYPSDTNQVQVCEICGEDGVLYKDSEATFKLCKKHLKKLLKRALKPDEFKKLYNRVGNVYIIHDDFYDPDTGEAFNPVDEDIE